MLRGMPRSTLRAASPAAAVSILADLAARTVRGKQAGTTLQGLFEGLQGAVDAAKERPQARGQQLLRDTEIQALLKASEQELLAVTEQEYASLWRRQRGRVVRGLAAWTDRRELCMERQFRWSH